MEHNYHHLDRSVLRELQDMLYECTNPFVTAFRTAGERLVEQESVALRLNCITAPRLDQRRYNRPTVHEVAAILVGSDANPTMGTRDIVIQERTGTLKRISDLHSSYLPLRYPLILPYGTPGWYTELHSMNLNRYESLKSAFQHY
jgi:hypothetical protein